MAQSIKNVMAMGAGGLFGTHVFTALQKQGCFNLTVLSRKSSKSKFPPDVKVVHIDDDYPFDQLVDAFKGQDALVSTIPGRPYSVHLRMIDAAVEAGVRRFIPSEYGNNTCAAASELVPLYGDKAKVISHLRQKEQAGLSWTALHTGQFFDWGLDDGWLDYHLKERRVVIYDSGNTRWSTTTIDTAALAVARILVHADATKNRNIFVASFTVSQNQVLEAVEKATGAKWDVATMTSAEAIRKAKEMDNADYSEGLKLLILMLMFADEVDRGANFEKDGLLCNEMLGLPVEDMATVVERVVKDFKG